MKFNRRAASTFLAAAAVALSAFAQNAIAGSGAYGSSGAMPTIYSKNLWHTVALPVVGSPPSTATVSTVYYSYSYPYPRPTGFVVLLCDNTGTYCADVTAYGSGSISFAGTGVKATTPVTFYAGVSGTGTMSPLAGGPVNVTVNYDF